MLTRFVDRTVIDATEVEPALEAAGLARTVFIRAIDSVSVNTQPFHVVNQSGSPSDREG